MREVKNAYKILVRNLKEGDNMQYLGVDDRILKCIFNKFVPVIRDLMICELESVDWIHQDKDQWLTVVNTARNLLVAERAWNLLTI
jgi:hypothetical protein